MKRIIAFSILALALACLPLCAQEAVLSVPLHKQYSYSPALPLFTLQHATGATGNLQEWKDTAGNVTLSVDASGHLSGSNTVTYSSTSSAQGLSADFTLAATAGKDHPNTAFLAGVMGNLFGANLTKTGNYLGGVIGMYSITGTNADHYPHGAVLAGIGDGTTTADGAVVAWIDGDSGQTNAGAAFKVRNRNSVPNSGFNYGVDLFDASTDGYPAVKYLVGDIRLSSGGQIFTGTADPNSSVTGANGSVYIRTGTGNKNTTIYVNTNGGTTWAAMAGV
jgi:hypothetical protein